MNILEPIHSLMLNRRAQFVDVNNLGFSTEELMKEMSSILVSLGGVGLSANQIGIPLRIFVISNPQHDYFKFFLNPIILSQSDEKTLDIEGCLSFPGLALKIPRSEVIEIAYYDENMTYKKDIFSGMTARIIQHEYCHMEGLAFFHGLTKFNLKRQLVKQKLGSEYSMLMHFLK